MADYVKIVAANRYNLDRGLVQNDDGEFLRIGGSDDKVYNYTIVNFIGDQIGEDGNAAVETTYEYTVTAATLKVDPITNQYKIYGEADPEIRFNVYTTYTVASAHYIPKYNIHSIDNAGTSVTIANLTTYARNADGEYVESGTGDYVKVESGWVVTLKGYAYEENITSSTYDLNYGKNFEYKQHPKVEKTLDQATTANTKHFDKYTTYKNSVNTSRILIGNLYVEDYNQNVGVRNILNGFFYGD